MAVHTLKKLKHLRKELSDKKTIFISGCFDLLHEGHLAFLKRAKKFGDVLIVGVLSDKYIRNHKKRNPAQNHLHRARLIDSLKFVDHVVLTPYVKNKYPSIEVLDTLCPKIFLRCEKTHMYKPIQQKLKKLGITLKTHFMKKINSTTDIINNIKKSN